MKKEDVCPRCSFPIPPFAREPKVNVQHYGLPKEPIVFRTRRKGERQYKYYKNFKWALKERERGVETGEEYRTMIESKSWVYMNNKVIQKYLDTGIVQRGAGDA